MGNDAQRARKAAREAAAANPAADAAAPSNNPTEAATSTSVSTRTFATGRAKANWLADVAAVLCSHYSLEAKLKVSEVVAHALSQLGKEEMSNDLDLVAKADACLNALGIADSVVADAKTTKKQASAAPTPPADGPETGWLVRWNDEKGFGFIQPEYGGQDIFCHRKSILVQDDPTRPVILDGAYVRFQRRHDASAGKDRAEEVELIEEGGGDDGAWDAAAEGYEQWPEVEEPAPVDLAHTYRKRWRYGLELDWRGKVARRNF